MPLVSNKYHSADGSNDETGPNGNLEEEDELKMYLPPRKKLKSCAPIPAPPPIPKPAFVPFEPLQIMHPRLPPPYYSTHTNTLASNSLYFGFNNKSPFISPPPTPFASTASSFWSPNNIYTPYQLLAVPDTVERTLKHSKKKSNLIARHSILATRAQSGLLPHQGPANCVKWSSVHGSLLLSASMDGSIALWNPFVNLEQKKVAHLKLSQAGIRDACWNKDNSSILSGGFDKKIHYLDVETGKTKLVIDQEAFVTCVAFQPASGADLLVCGLSNGCVMAYDPRDHTNILNNINSSSKDSSNDSSNPSTSLDHYLNSASNSKLEKGKLTDRFIRRIQGLPGQVLSMTFLDASSSNPKIITSSDPADRGALEHSVVVWDWLAGTPLSNGIFCEPHPCTYLLAHPHQPYFVAQCAAGYIPVFSSNAPFKRRKKLNFKGHDTIGFTVKLDFSPDGELLYSGSSAGQIYVYNWNSLKLVKTIPIFETKDACVGIAHHPVLNSTIAACSWSGNVSIWE